MTQLIPFRADLDAPTDDIREAIVDAVCMARARVDAKAKLMTRIEEGGVLATDDGRLAHVLAELLLDAANAFPGPIAASNVVVLTCTRLAGFAVIRIADNGPLVPRHGLCLAALVESMGGGLRAETTPGGCSVVTVLVPIEPTPATA
jgi:signal transduction histidine kinase